MTSTAPLASGPRIGSLFSGYGGLDMAARAVFGGDVVWHCDIKPAAVTLLGHHFPGTPNLGDITTIHWADVPPVDVLTFGWPCQPHSSAGKRLGEADPRALWPHVARAAGAVRPAVLLGENVARVASNGELRRVVRTLAALGYVGAWRCVTAAEVGAPHKRGRLALVAVRADAAADAPGVGWCEGWAEHAREFGGSDAAERGCATAGLTLLPTPTARNSAGIDQRNRPGSQGLDLQTVVTLLKTPTANLATNGGTQHPDKRKAGGHGPTLTDEVEWLLPTPTVADSRNARNATAGRSEGQEHHHPGWTLSDVAHAERWGTYAAAVERWERVLGRSAPAPTQPSARASTGRVLASAFVEWMMGLPAGWVTDVPGLSRNQQLSLLGDGVVPQQLAHGFRLALADLAASVAGERAA